MSVVKCEKCGGLLHKTDRCFFCGNIIKGHPMSSALNVHENVKDEYEALEHLVKNEKYTEALRISDLVQEWMPFCSDVFWMRLLAKHKCPTDEALIRKGFSYEDSAEYYNAVFFADDIQKKVYLSISEKISSVRNVLQRYIEEHEYAEKRNTPILNVQKNFSAEIDSRRKKLFQLWEALRETEKQIAVIEKDCLLLIHEYKETLDTANSVAASFKKSVCDLQECTIEQLHTYQTLFGKLLCESEGTKEKIDSMRKQHPWIGEFDALVKKRDGIALQINDEINSLRSYEEKVQSTVAEIEKIEAVHAKALASVKKFDFSGARSVLGEERFHSAFDEAGVK